MAELPSKRKQLTRQLGPSPLQHELSRDSTDNEHECEQDNVLEPQSDVVIPETQFDDYDHGPNKSWGDSEPPSPTSGARLQQSDVVKKSIEVPVETLFFSRPLSKPDPKSTHDAVPTFSFSKLERTARKVLPKNGFTASQSETLQSPELYVTEDMRLPATEGNNTIATSRKAAETQHLAIEPHPLGDVDRSFPQWQTKDNGHPRLETDHAESTALGPVFVPPTVSQPDPHSATIVSNTRTAKKGMRMKKGSLRGAHHASWPPRSKHNMKTGPDHPVFETLTGPSSSHAVESQDTQAGPHFTTDTMPPNDPGRAYEEAPLRVTGSTEDAQQGIIRDEQAEPAIMFRMEQFGSLSMQTTSSQQASPVSPEPSSVVSFEQLPAVMAVEPEPHTGPRSRTAAHGTTKRLPPQLFQHGNARSDVQRIDTADNAYLPPESLPTINADQAAQNQHTRDRATDAILHQASGRGVSPKVNKVQKRVRANGQSPHPSHSFSVPSAVERSLETLRVAMLAERFRKDHDNAMVAKHHQEMMNMLQEQVKLQAETITELRGRNQGLNNEFARLRDKAITNQKYVAGLQTDHENLQKNSRAMQEKHKEVLQNRVDELEREKDLLRSELGDMLEAFAKNQRTTSKTVELLYVRLIIAESKNKELAKSLDSQIVLYEKERGKCDELDNQVLSVTRSMQQRVESACVGLNDMLDTLCVKVDKSAVSCDQDAKVTECLALLQDLRSTPFLTAQDVKKAEGMLRFVHERMDATMQAFGDVTTTKSPMTEDMQTYIRDQLQSLQHEMRKHTGPAEEYQEIRELNAALQKQLTAKEQSCKTLEDQIKELEQVEGNLRARSMQLEQELINNKECESALLNQERDMVAKLRQQLNKAGDDLAATTLECKQKEQTYQGLKEEFRLAKEQIEELRESVNTLNLEVETTRQAKLEMEKQLNTVQQTASQVTELNNRLQHKTDALQRKTQDCAALQRQNVDLSTKTAALQNSCDTLHAQLSQHHSVMDTMREKADRQLSEVQKNAIDAQQSAQAQNLRLEEEKQACVSKLEQAQSEETRIKEVHAMLLAERDSLVQQTHQLRSLIDAKDAELSDCKKDAAEETRNLTEGHIAEIADWTQRLLRSETALKESKANMRCMQDQHRAKIESDRRIVESNLYEIEEQYRVKLRDAEVQGRSDQQQTSQSSIVHETPPQSLHNNEVAKTIGQHRKKVNRENRPVLGLSGGTTSQPVATSKLQLTHHQREPSEFDESALEGGFNFQDFFDEPDASIQQPATEYVAETQDLEAFSQLQDRASNVQKTSSTNLTDVDTDELTQMGPAVQRASTPMLYGPGHMSSKLGTMPGAGTEISKPTGSHDRPRSQANTASRMMPPPPAVSQDSEQRLRGHGPASGSVFHRPTHDRSERESESSGAQTPDSMHVSAWQQGHAYGPSNLPHEQSHGIRHKRKNSSSPFDQETPSKKPQGSSSSRPRNAPSSTNDLLSDISRPMAAGSRSRMGMAPKVSPSVASGSNTRNGTSGVRARKAQQSSSSLAPYNSHSQQTPSSRGRNTGATPRNSTRVTRSKGKGGIAAYEDRFSQELDRF